MTVRPIDQAAPGARLLTLADTARIVSLAAAITPGNELPGGWGPTPPASTTGPNATTTIYQDISSALNTVGQAAYSAPS